MKFIINLIVCCFICQYCFTQTTDTTIITVSRKLVSNIISSDKEKAWIVTDRNIYDAGETVYFKAFLVDSIRNYLQTTPQKLYVDYVDDQDKVINQVILNNSGLQNTGLFTLPDSLPENHYWLRAYTDDMVHDDLNNIGVAPIYIVNRNKIAKTNTATTNQYQDSKVVLRLYPEGGSIISGLNSSVAVSVKDDKENPLVVSGLIKDKFDSVIATFNTNKYGLAKFSYFPKWFQKYSVSIKNMDHYETITSLPKVNFFAAQISVTQQSQDFITVRVALEDSIYSKDYTTYLIAVSGDNLCFTSIGRGMYNVTIPTSKFPGGIVTLYLVNANNEILSSRNVYINKQDLQLLVQADKKNYSARDKIKLSLKFADKNNKPEVGIFSLSVTDKNLLDTSFDFLLNNTLHNFSDEDADLIMLTQPSGINSLNLASSNKTYIDDTDIILSGKISDNQDVPIEHSEITILSNQANPIIETDTTDVKGRFKFHLPAYPDNTLFTYQLNNAAGKSISAYHIEFDNTSIHFSTPSKLKTESSLNKILTMLKTQLATLDSLNVLTNKEMLKPVFVQGIINKIKDYDTTKRISHSSHIITSKMIGDGPGMAGNALLNVPGLRLMNGYIIVGAPNDLNGVSVKDEPLIVLDGTEVNVAQDEGSSQGSPVINFLNALPVQTIDFIEVLTGPEAANYGVEGGKGVIAVNTASKLNNPLIATTGLKTFYAKGFYNNKPFEMPDYSNKQILKSKLPDLRKTIYWNGNIATDKKGEALVQFFSGDHAATYLCVINGVTVNGNIIHQTFTISRN